MSGGIGQVLRLKRPESATEKWPECFRIDDDSGDGAIRLHQRDSKRFDLGTRIEYRFDKQMGLGKLGLTAAEEAALRVVHPHELRGSDLASVPPPFRWWAQSYGLHTPAALIHDKFIGEAFTGDPNDRDIIGPDGPPQDFDGVAKIYRPAKVTDSHIDRYFRFMLMELGVSWLRRWVMWAAVAGRSRFQGGLRQQILLGLWIGAAFSGSVLLLRSLNDPWSVSFFVGLLLPVPAGVFWGRQYGAGLIIAYFAVPLLLTPALVAIPALGAFVVVEGLVAIVGFLRRKLFAR